MAQEYRIVSRFNEDVEYTFDDMLLDEDDEMTESDIHHIELFGKPYSIAMGKLKNGEEDENLGFFICYLLYGKKVIRKLGIYEINMSTNEMTSLNHRTFNFEKEKLILFDEYYEDTEKLLPYMYKKEEDIPTKTIVRLKQVGAEFEEDVDQQKMLLQQLQARVEKYKPEKSQKILDKYNRYLTYLNTASNEKAEKEILKRNIIANFKTINAEGKSTFSLDRSILHENLLLPDVALAIYNLIMFELMANIKIIVIENEDFDFHLMKYKEDTNYEKMNTLDIYKNVNPQEVMFIHKSYNEDEETILNILQYNGKLFNSFGELGNDKLIKLIQDKLNEYIEEEQHPTRFAHLKSISVKVEDEKPEPEEEDEVENLDAEEEEEQENEEAEAEEPEEEPEEPEEEETKGEEEMDKKISLTPTKPPPKPKLKISE